MSVKKSVAKLVVQRDRQREQTIEIAEALTIGRSIANQLILEDNKISRNHAEIRRMAPGRYRLIDLGSVNGTYINRRLLTAPCELHNGDLIEIGEFCLRFETSVTAVADVYCSVGTAPELKDVYVVTMVADIREYTAMSEVLPREEFSLLVKDWFKECSRLVQARGGTIDKFIGDAVMCYWLVPDRTNPVKEVSSALAAARNLITAAADFSRRLWGIFPGHVFAIGVGVSMGKALLGNVGTDLNQSITLVGDNVNIAFRLEALTRERKAAVIVTSNIAECVALDYTFVDLGQVAVKGRKHPVAISELVLAFN